ncbi:helix-turn-helix domain-containing protein [Marinomonas aquiplantarum]|uniref:Helix-turn-helix protein n=1 Tax=Marinomonas aquiplantarum TaxID=491951 RepID=A0A366CZD3_9GAMM|nr:helix-turn-helix domain-containing protein [Marinomonas aquiplantarum]RBO82599.1 helix-turn-helix protein [Marinomonas aquiplantarum]
MSMELMVKAMKTKVGNPLRKLVLIKLADNANDQGECWPSYQYIADQCEIGKRTVISHIDSLIESGLLTKTIRKGAKGNSSNVYVLNLDAKPVNNGGANAAPPSANVAPPSANAAPPSANAAPGGGANAAPRTSHFLEPVKEPVNSLVVPPKRKKSKRASGVPDEFLVDQRMLDWLTENQIITDWRTETNNFLDHHRAKGSTMADWVAAWRTWMRNSMKFATGRPAPPHSAKQQVHDSLSNIHDTDW